MRTVGIFWPSELGGDIVNQGEAFFNVIYNRNRIGQIHHLISKE